MSSWIQHCKNYQQQHGCSYKDALQRAKASYQKGGAIKIAPTLVSSVPSNVQLQDSERKSDTIKNPTDLAKYIDGMEYRIKKNVGMYGEEPEEKIQSKPKRRKPKINKKKTNKNSLDAKIKAEENKWANLLQSNQGVTACKPNETEVKAHCRRKKR